VELKTVPNELYRLETLTLSTDGYAAEYAKRVAGNPEVGMAYGRMSVDPGQFLKEAELNIFHRVSPQPDPLPNLQPENEDWLKRVIFRGSVGNDFGKKLRWVLEKALGEHVSKKNLTRNQLQNSDASFFLNRTQSRTDILHEYFLPPENFAPMVQRLSEAVARHHGDLLNVTVRQVLKDDDTYMAYARGERLALVLFFNQPITPEAEKDMQEMTRELIDSALELGGTYYLPYRLAATQQQFERAYPQAKRFFELKKHYDPSGLFQNEFYRKYADK
jgi:FAD/FMN-containing dehydrogenase